MGKILTGAEHRLNRRLSQDVNLEVGGSWVKGQMVRKEATQVQVLESGGGGVEGVTGEEYKRDEEVQRVATRHCVSDKFFLGGRDELVGLFLEGD